MTSPDSYFKKLSNNVRYSLKNKPVCTTLIQIIFTNKFVCKLNLLFTKTTNKYYTYLYLLDTGDFLKMVPSATCALRNR